ncbi:MAG TPA: MarR family transcriptional regulator [Microbacterium sp.]|nr:MarR family transcriptional regulator [Microbacterium sp.]
MTGDPASPDGRRPFADAPLSQAVFRVARLHKSIAAQLLRDAGLRPGQELVLVTLWSEGPQRLVDLVRTLGTDAPAMTRSIARLEKAGLVVRRRSPLDGRAVIVEATDASLPLRPKVEAAWAQLEQLTAGGASARRQAEILDTLTELESHLTRDLDTSED